MPLMSLGESTLPRAWATRLKYAAYMLFAQREPVTTSANSYEAGLRRTLGEVLQDDRFNMALNLSEDQAPLMAHKQGYDLRAIFTFTLTQRNIRGEGFTGELTLDSNDQGTVIRALADDQPDSGAARRVPFLTISSPYALDFCLQDRNFWAEHKALLREGVELWQQSLAVAERRDLLRQVALPEPQA